jgi:DNA-binding NtrC family response regulator
MQVETPWASCFLTRLLILYLERIGKGETIPYDRLMEGPGFFSRIEEPKAFLKNYNNWVPYHVLRNLIWAAEKANGNKEVSYLAARDCFRSHDGPPLIGILAHLIRDEKEGVLSSHLWAGGYTNYLKLQCLDPAGATGLEVNLLARFREDVEPQIGSIHLIRGCYEGMMRLFPRVEEAVCEEVLSQLKIETVLDEFPGHAIEKKGDLLVIKEARSGREIAEARTIYLRSESAPLIPALLQSEEDLVLPPQKESVTLLTPQVEEDNRAWRHEKRACQIVRGGVLRAGPLSYSLQEGKIFNAPYSRFRFTWKTKEAERGERERPMRPEVISLFFEHMRELRESQQCFLKYTIENEVLAQVNEQLRQPPPREWGLFGIVGKSAKMQKLLEQIQLIGPSDSTVLIVGETGTGKELLAKAIHQLSLRQDRSFYAVNCAALTESLLESELFGYEKGAFTGAAAQKKGIFETAQGGTLFLDEIGEISLNMQAKLLRVLEEQEIQRIGGRETIPIDIRVLSATNRNLEECVATGKFRSDLYYRLNVISLHIPPLRERREDIPLLATYFVNLFSKKQRKESFTLTREALGALMSHAWPGNIRQLRNVIERAVVLGRDQVITPEDLTLPGREPSEKEEEEPVKFHDAVDSYKRSIVEQALDRTGGNQTRAAELLGLQRTYLVRLIRIMNLRSDRLLP